MAEPCVDLENPVGARGERLAVAADVGVRDAARLGRPDDPKPGLPRLVSLEQRYASRRARPGRG